MGEVENTISKCRMIFFMPNHIKILITLIVALILNAQTLYAEDIDKITIQGNKSISTETIKIFGDIKKGNYSEKDINLLIKKLYETEFFSSVSVEIKNNNLYINVKEFPIINQIVFKGEKADKYLEKLDEYLTLQESVSFSKEKLNKDVNTIKEFYKQAGYYFVDLSVDIEELSDDKVNVVYNLVKGEKAKISKIYFVGDKKVRDKKLREIITSEETRFWKFISRGKFLNEQRIELDERLLQNFYINSGYYEAKVNSSSVEYQEGDGFALTFSIEAGKRYKFKKVSINVVDGIDKKYFLELNEPLLKVVGKYYSRTKLQKILDQIDKLTIQKELQFINHRLLETLEGNDIIVKIEIFEGPKFFVEKINIVGNNVTNDSVIRSEMIVDEGDPYSEVLLARSLNNIKAKRIFSSVESKALPGSESGRKIIEIKVEEKATGEIAAGAGVGTSGTTVGGSVTENNFLGRGIKLESMLEVSEETIRGKLSVVNPNYKFSGNSLKFSVQTIKDDRISTSGYESTDTGFSLGTKFEQYEDLFISPDFSVFHNKLETDGSASSTIKKMEGNYFSATLGYGITNDKRDRKFQTTDGYITRFYQRLPLVADVPTLVHGFEFSSYQQLGEDVVGSLKFYSRAVNGLDDDVRIGERAHLPAKYLKGFESRKIGPKDGDDFVGGNYAAALGFNVSFPSLLPENMNTDVNLFLDTGNVWHADYSGTVGESNKLRSSFGISANWFSPIGPFNFVFAQDITSAETDITESFRFNLGTTF